MTFPRWIIAVVGFVALSGCGVTRTIEKPVITVVEKPVPVQSPCVPKTLGTAPEYPDTDDALRTATDASERYRLLAQGRPLRVARLAELETVVAGCPK